MANLPKNTTAYSEFVFSNVRLALSGGAGAYDYNTLASKVGLKPTQHFKRRIRQMVSEGQLKSFTAFTPRGGLMLVFTLPDAPEVVEIPF